jgi:hypothetical protein
LLAGRNSARDAFRLCQPEPHNREVDANCRALRCDRRVGRGRRLRDQQVAPGDRAIVVSDAVDKTVASIDFSPLSGKRVFFDTQYLDGVNMGANGNIKYVVSSLRQQMLAYDLRLQEKPDTAEYIVEARVGVLANDGYEVTYGIPGSAAVASASALLASPIPVPAMPELSLGRRNHQVGTAKIGLFAFDRVTREPVWQAGVRKGASEARDTWLLGLGPYHRRSSAKSGVAELPRTTTNRTAGTRPDIAYGETVVSSGRFARLAAAASTQAAAAPSQGAASTTRQRSRRSRPSSPVRPHPSR